MALPLPPPEVPLTDRQADPVKDKVPVPQELPLALPVGVPLPLAVTHLSVPVVVEEGVFHPGEPLGDALREGALEAVVLLLKVPRRVTPGLPLGEVDRDEMGEPDPIPDTLPKELRVPLGERERAAEVEGEELEEAFT